MHKLNLRIAYWPDWVVVLFALAAALVGYLSVAMEPGTSIGASELAETPQFQLWAALSATQFFFWALGFVYLLRRHLQSTDLVNYRSVDQYVVLAVLAAIAGPIGITYLTADVITSPLAAHEWRIMFQIAVGVGATSPGIVILERVRRTSQSDVKLGSFTDEDGNLRDAVRTRHALTDGVIMILSGLIALTVLSTGALQGALEEAVERRGGGPTDVPNDFIIEFVVLFGLQLSMVLGALALRTAGPLRELRNAVVDNLLPERSVTSADWVNVDEKRSALRESLHPRDDSNLGATVAVLVPLGSALVSAML